MQSYRYTAIDVAQVGRDEVNEARPLAWLSYVSILFLVPLLAMRGNRFALFHAKQGMILFAYKVGVVIVGVVLSAALIGVLILVVGEMIVLILSIIGIVKSALGEFWKCPFWVHELAQRLPIA